MKTTIAAAVAATLALAAPAIADDASPFGRAVAHEAGVSPARAEMVIRAAREALGADRAVDLPLLMALAVRESNLLPSVEACQVTGDGGRAVGLWQEHARGERRAALCGGGAHAQAAEAVRHLTSCGAGDAERVACYAGRSVTHRIVTDRLALAARLRAAR
jgi:hypothetical protein